MGHMYDDRDIGDHESGVTAEVWVRSQGGAYVFLLEPRAMCGVLSFYVNLSVICI